MRPIFFKPKITEEVSRLLHTRKRAQAFKQQPKVALHREEDADFLSLQVIIPSVDQLPDGREGEIVIYRGMLWYYSNGWKDTGIVVATGGNVAVVSSKDDISLGSDSGTLWFVTDTSELYLLYSSTLIRIPYAYASYGSSPPSSPSVGDLWYDTSAQQLMIYSGTEWVVAGGGGGGSIVYSNAVTDTNVISGTAGAEQAATRGDHKHSFIIPSSFTNNPAVLQADRSLMINKGGLTQWIIIPAAFSSSLISSRTHNASQRIQIVTLEGLPAWRFEALSGETPADMNVTFTLPMIFEHSTGYPEHCQIRYKLFVYGQTSKTYVFRLEVHPSWWSGEEGGISGTANISVATDTLGRGSASGSFLAGYFFSGDTFMRVVLRRLRTAESYPSPNSVDVILAMQVLYSS